MSRSPEKKIVRSKVKETKSHRIQNKDSEKHCDEESRYRLILKSANANCARTLIYIVVNISLTLIVKTSLMHFMSISAILHENVPNAHT